MNNNQIIILILIGMAMLGAYSIYQPFLLSVVVAILLFMATYNVMEKLNSYLKSRRLAAASITLLLALVIFAPIIYIATVGVSYASTIDIPGIMHTLEYFKNQALRIPHANEWILHNLSNEQLLAYIQQSTTYFTSWGQAGIGFLKNMFFVLIFYYIMNYYGDRLFNLLHSLLPLSKTRNAKMIREISSTMEVVFYSTIATAILEGILFGLIVGFFGFNGLLFGIIYGLASLIPIIGGTIVWVPISLYMWSHGNANGAAILALYSIIIISIIADTFIKPIIIKIIKKDFLKNNSEINELIIFFAIFAGMSSYGFWGVILGPAITTFFIAMMKVYIEYNAEDN
ncbi:MAG: AI-2E family transporter [Sulfurovaceae bacterium]|nr:AI-2E family transporter [Sulfurovaceae bacterium]